VPDQGTGCASTAPGSIAKAMRSPGSAGEGSKSHSVSEYMSEQMPLTGTAAAETTSAAFKPADGQAFVTLASRSSPQIQLGSPAACICLITTQALCTVYGRRKETASYLHLYEVSVKSEPQLYVTAATYSVLEGGSTCILQQVLP